MGRRSEKPIGENEEDVSTAGRSQRNESKRKSLKDESEDTDEDVETPARKRTSAKNRDRKEVENDDELSDPDDDNEENEEPVPKKSQRKKKETKETNNEDQEYDVEKIVGDRAIKGRIQYKIRWKGYESEDDTWENESTLDCNELIEEYNDAKGDDDVIAKRSPGAKTKADRRSASTSSSSKKEKSVSERKKAMASQHSGNAPDSDGEWEVSKLIDMHTNKNGSREFLVRWKGFPPEDDSWEPEEHLKGTEILERFLKKVEQARAASEKELRVRRKPTDFYAPTTFQKQGGVRASKRFTHRERAKYYDAD